MPGTVPTPLFDPTKTNSVLIAASVSMGRGSNITIRAMGSATERQEAMNRYHSVLGAWTVAPSHSFVKTLNASVST